MVIRNQKLHNLPNIRLVRLILQTETALVCRYAGFMNYTSQFSKSCILDKWVVRYELGSNIYTAIPYYALYDASDMNAMRRWSSKIVGYMYFEFHLKLEFQVKVGKISKANYLILISFTKKHESVSLFLPQLRNYIVNCTDGKKIGIS